MEPTKTTKRIANTILTPSAQTVDSPSLETAADKIICTKTEAINI